jgi:hypothetical protein
LTLKAKYKIKIKNPLTYLVPTYQHTYLPNIYLFTYYLSTYLRTFYPPTHLFTYLPTYLHKLKLIIKKYHVANFNYAKWQYVSGLYFNCKNGIGYKLHINDQWMKPYMLTIYIIHVECVNVMANHHLWLDVGCDFIYAINEILIIYVDCNLFIITNYSHKLTPFF